MQGRIIRGMSPTEILEVLRESEGYYLCNNERDVSQSDFKNRLMPMTTVRVAPYREAAGFFSVEVSGGASVHVDLMRKQVNPFERLRITRKAMPQTLLQTVCRGSSLFGYRHYPENVIRLAVREFARYVDVWRVYDFLNHVPNMIPVMDEVQKADRLLMPSICFSTGPEHTDRYYVDKVKEILEVTGSRGHHLHQELRRPGDSQAHQPVWWSPSVRPFRDWCSTITAATPTATTSGA